MAGWKPGAAYTPGGYVDNSPGPDTLPAPAGGYAVSVCGQGRPTAPKKPHAAGDSMRPGILNTCQASYG